MDNLIQSIKSKGHLTATSKKIGSYFLNHPQVFLNHDANYLGQITHTSAASIIRFCKQLGYKGLNDFKIQAAQRTSEAESKIDTIVEKDDSLKQIMTKLVVNSRKNIQNTAASINLRSLDAAVKLLKKAKNIYLEGVAASGLAAKDLYYKFIRAGKSAFFDSDVHIALERINNSNPADVVVIFSYSGLTKEIVLAAKAAKKNKTPIIAVTRQTTSIILQMADVVIGLPSTEQLLRIGAIDSLSSEIFVSSLLYLSTINTELDQVESRMKNTEKLTNYLKEGEEINGD